MAQILLLGLIVIALVACTTTKEVPIEVTVEMTREVKVDVTREIAVEVTTLVEVIATPALPASTYSASDIIGIAQFSPGRTHDDDDIGLHDAFLTDVCAWLFIFNTYGISERAAWTAELEAPGRWRVTADCEHPEFSLVDPNARLFGEWLFYEDTGRLVPLEENAASVTPR